MSRWKVAEIVSKAWAAVPLDDPLIRGLAVFPTWRQAYQYALVRARQESAQDDWTPEPVPTSGRNPESRQNPTVNR